MKRVIVGAAAALGLALGLATMGGPAMGAAPALTGTWRTASGNLEVKVAPCGAKLCGTVAKVLSNQSMAHSGAPMTTAPATGLKILDGLEAKSDGAWAGKIYNRENGKTYDCRITLPAADRMELRAYVVLPLFGQTQVWKRVG
jgi:uncharacterized protein (DUF2147 family)